MREATTFVVTLVLAAVLSCSTYTNHAAAQDICDDHWISLRGLLASFDTPPRSISPLQPVVGIFPDPRDPRPLSAAEERALVQLDHFKECDRCPEMVVVPTGDFVMGSPETEEGGSPDERPQHKVSITRRFSVGRFAVTFDEWDACVAERGCKNYQPADRGWGRGRRPVINVSWEDANAYVAWLSNKTGKSYRL